MSIFKVISLYLTFKSLWSEEFTASRLGVVLTILYGENVLLMKSDSYVWANDDLIVVKVVKKEIKCSLQIYTYQFALYNQILSA